MIMAQTGFEWYWPIKKWVGIGAIAKTALGGNEIELTTRLTNAAGMVGSELHNSKWTYASVNEFTLYLDLIMFDKMRLRAGYTAMWLLNVGEGLSQIDYNLANTTAGINDRGSVFFHGPILELEFLF